MLVPAFERYPPVTLTVIFRRRLTIPRWYPKFSVYSSSHEVGIVQSFSKIPTAMNRPSRNLLLSVPYVVAIHSSSTMHADVSRRQVESFQLGTYLKSTYLDSSSPLHIRDMPLDPSHPIPPSKVNVHAKSGGEGAAIFDSGIALLQGLFPPTERNKIELANGSTVVAPLGGYQYVPVEMSTEGGDRVLEPWTDCKVRMSLTTSRGYHINGVSRLSKSTFPMFMLPRSSNRPPRTQNTSSDRSMTTCSADLRRLLIW